MQPNHELQEIRTGSGADHPQSPTHGTATGGASRNVLDYTEDDFKTIDRMNIGAAFFHGAQFVVMLILSLTVESFKAFKLPIRTNYLVAVPFLPPNVTMAMWRANQSLSGGREYLDTASSDVGTVEFGPMVSCFFLLSCLAHVIVQLPGVRKNYYHAGLNRGQNYFRWIEYAFSSSLMIWLIAMLFGIYDIATLVLITICNASMNLCGLLMEQVNEVRNPEADINWFPFWLGSLLGAGPWIAIFQYLGVSRSNNAEVPNFVWGILFGYIIMFNTFPVNMIVQYMRKIDYLKGERIYIILSFVAKCLLCWLVFGGAQQPNEYRGN